MTRPTVIVVGAGNAALVSALSAHESGAKVTICEAANEEDMGGNSRFTFASFRFGSQGVDDVKALVPAMSDADTEIVRNAPYTPQDFFNHLMTLSHMRADPELCEMLAKASYDTLAWMKRLGVEWDISISDLPREPLWRLSPGSVFASGRGKGLIKTLLSAVQSRDIQIRYGTSLESIIKEDGRVTGAVFQREGSPLTLHCDALILACGSFEASSDMRKSSMGAEWAAMKVRGTRFNTGKGLIAALAVGAQPHGNWAGGHGVPVDAASKEFGELALGETTRRCLFQYGITVDENGKRFMDEGQDRKTFMYGITGVEVARQPGARAFQIFDAKIMTANFEKLFYFSSGYLVAQTLDELALMMGVPKAAFIDEVGAYRHRHQQAL
jgi:tricarballylate dehydrogenase